MNGKVLKTHKSNIFHSYTAEIALHQLVKKIENTLEDKELSWTSKEHLTVPLSTLSSELQNIEEDIYLNWIDSMLVRRTIRTIII